MISCSIDISNACQNKCAFCLSKEHLDGTLIDFDIYCNLIYDLYLMGVKTIVFSGGGEPLLHPLFRDIVLSAKNLGFKLGVFTNGIDLNKYVYLLKHFEWIKISLDSGSPKSYRKIKGSDYFGKVIQNAIRASEITDVTIGWVLHEDNSDEIFGVEKILPKAKSINIKRDARHHKRIPDATACSKADSLGIVTADAKVYYCPSKRWDGQYLLGDLKQNSIFEIWENRKNINPDITTCDDCRFGTNLHDGFI